MTSYSVSMDYESLSTVLLYTDPNLRFKMAQRIPKIRLTEKIVPLRIELEQLLCWSVLYSGLPSFKNRKRSLYNHELCEAVKKFNEILFANRPPIIVNRFQCEHFDGIWRIPVGFKIAANSVYGENTQMAPISSVLDSSRKLRKLSVSVTSELVSDFQHSFVRNAEILSIHSVKRESGWLATALETIENRQIHIELIDFENPSPNEYFQLIQGWASMKRSVGSLITFEFRTDEIGEEILELVRARNERTESTDRCVTVLQSNSTILEVFYCGINIENSSELLLTAMIMEA